MGLCPCPRCLVEKKDIHLLGTAQDMRTRTYKLRADDDTRRQKVVEARKRMYEDGRVVGSVAVEELLKEESLVPTTVSRLAMFMKPWDVDWHMQ